MDNSMISKGRMGKIAVMLFSSFGHLRWGGQKSLFYLATRLDGTRYRPVVVVPTDEELAAELRKRDIEVLVFPLTPLLGGSPFRALKTIRRLTQLIEEKQISLLHTDGPRNTLYAALAARTRSLPLVWHIRSSDKDKFDNLLIPLCDRVILVAEALRNRFSPRHWEKKFVTIHNGIDLAEFDRTPSASLREDYGISPETIIIGSFARIEAMKGQLTLIEACEALKDLVPLKLVLFGEIHDADYYRDCRETVERLNLQEHVIFGGHQEDAGPYMKGVDIVVLNSPFAEAFPRVIIEAMAAAKPVIATDVGGCREAVEDDVTGFIIPPGNRMALRDRIQKLALDPSLRNRFGRVGRQRAERLFSLEINIRKTVEVYGELI